MTIQSVHHQSFYKDSNHFHPSYSVSKRGDTDGNQYGNFRPDLPAKEQLKGPLIEFSSLNSASMLTLVLVTPYLLNSEMDTCTEIFEVKKILFIVSTNNSHA